METIFKQIIQYVSIFLILTYFYGFIAWNYVLGKFGFFEYDLLQTRYLSAGFLFLIFVGILFLLCIISLKNKLKNIQLNATKIIFLLLFLIVIDITIFVHIIFPSIPQYLGGANPIPLSFIGDQDQILFLNNFNIPKTQDSSVQTTWQCGLYQNKDYIIIGAVGDAPDLSPRRILTLKLEEIKGMSVVRKKELKDFNKKICKKFITIY